MLNKTKAIALAAALAAAPMVGALADTGGPGGTATTSPNSLAGSNSAGTNGNGVQSGTTGSYGSTVGVTPSPYTPPAGSRMSATNTPNQPMGSPNTGAATTGGSDNGTGGAGASGTGGTGAAGGAGAGGGAGASGGSGR